MNDFNELRLKEDQENASKLQCKTNLGHPTNLLHKVDRFFIRKIKY